MNGRTFHFGAGVAALSAVLASAPGASAVTVRDDQAANAAYTSPSAASFPSVGLNSYTISDVTTGVLVAPNWVLTAAHAFTLNPTLTTLTLPNGNSYNVVPGSFAFEPTGADLALFRIQQQAGGPALPNASQVATLYTGTAELNKTSTNVGYGYGGTGTTGENPAAFPRGVRRLGENMIDAYGTQNGATIDLGTNPAGAQYLIADFDNPLAPSAANGLAGAVTSLESGLGTGDSGGGVYINDGSGVKLAGILVARGTGTGNYGDLIVAERISPRVAWINSVIPEPGSAALFALGGAAASLWRRRRR
jgi:hypothetical protein